MAGERILVVDDSKENRDFIVDYILKPHGFEPVQARDGVEGMELARQHLRTRLFGALIFMKQIFVALSGNIVSPTQLTASPTRHPWRPRRPDLVAAPE